MSSEKIIQSRAWYRQEPTRFPGAPIKAPPDSWDFVRLDRNPMGGWDVVTKRLGNAMTRLDKLAMRLAPELPTKGLSRGDAIDLGQKFNDFIAANEVRAGKRGKK